MKVNFGNGCLPAVTLVSNEFIDCWMPSANGEYVKVFLYLLRHTGEEITAGGIAEALELTEGDVRRALSRWERQGLIRMEPAAGTQWESARIDSEEEAPEPRREGDIGQETESRRGTEESAEQEQEEQEQEEQEQEAQEQEAQEQEEQGIGATDSVTLNPIPDKGGIDFVKLRENEEFTQLLYVIQRYLSKIFSQTDNETIAYLYDVLELPADLLVYLAERCAQNRKTSLRYFESVALDWYRRGIRTTEQAKKSGGQYTAEVYGVMRAFGLNGRDPGTEELRFIRSWYDGSGLSDELILEACSRTLIKIGKPSFPYADRIIKEWKNEGIRTKEDMERLETARAKDGKKNRGPAVKSGKSGGTRFNNFEQRNDDLDALALRMMKKKLGQG
ncbi:hypothetical protein B6K86_04680 [Lachnospiraceae bacterium]|nr:hypothetical protein B6K86_04680 [Lachnospiraceae bacterium]